MDPRLCTRCVEFRASKPVEGEGDGRTLRGYATVFSQPTRIESWLEGRFDEQMDPRAFNKTLKERTPIMQWDHGFDPSVGHVPIGVYKRITPDEHGLDVEGPLHEDAASERVMGAIRSGAVTGMSIKFRVIRDEWRDGSGKLIKEKSKLYKMLYAAMDGDPDAPEEIPMRTIKEVQLYEAGPVSSPAYPQTSVGVRALEDERRGGVDRNSIVAGYLRLSADDDEDETRSDTAQVTQSADDDEMGEDGLRKSDSEKPYGDVPYADPGYQKDGKKRYPIDTKDHVKAAWSYINQKANAAKYTSDQVTKIKNKIKSAAKKLGVEISEDSKKSADTDLSETRSAAPSGTLQPPETPTDAAPAGTSVERDNKSTNDSREGKAMNLEALRARRDEIVKRATELDTEFRDAVMPDEQDVEFESLKRELEEVDGKIASIEKRQEFAKALAAKPGNVDKAPAAPATSKPGQRKETPAFIEQRDEEDIFDLEDLSARSYSGAEFLQRVGDNAKFAIERAEYGVDDEDKARTHVEQLLKRVDTKDKTLAKRILLTGSEDYVNGFAKYLRHGSDAFCTTEERQALLRAQSLQGASGAEGGYAVPFQLDPTVILTSAGVYNPIRDLARVETIVGRKWQGVTTAGTTVSRGAEGTTAPESDIDLAQPELDTNRVQGFVPFSIEIELAWGALLREITKCLVDAKQTEEDSFITGDGVTGDEPGGVVGSLAGNTVTAGGVAAFADSDLYALQNALAPRWERNASWLGHKAIYHLIRQFDTSGGGMFWGSLAQGNPNTILDYPIYKSSAMASVLTTGSKILLHGDFKNFLIVDRIGMTVEMIPHVFDSAAGNRPKGQRGVYAYWMNNSKILVPSAFKLLVTG